MTTTLSPEERSDRARIAAHARFANGGAVAHAAHMRAALIEKYRQQIDPCGLLDLTERDRRIKSAMGADLSRARLRAAKARRERAAAELIDQLLEVGGGA